jgi:hypothetical protein
VNEHLDESIRGLRPQPPSCLRERCAPTGTSVSTDTTELWKEASSMRVNFTRAGTLAAAIILVGTIIWALPGSNGRASAAVLEAALSAFGEAPAVHVTMTTDHGPDTEIVDVWEQWLVAGLGSRFESDENVEINNVATNRRSWLDRRTGTVEVT